MCLLLRVSITCLISLLMNLVVHPVDPKANLRISYNPTVLRM